MFDNEVDFYCIKSLVSLCAVFSSLSNPDTTGAQKLVRSRTGSRISFFHNHDSVVAGTEAKE